MSPQLKSKLLEIQSDVILIHNLAGCIGDDDVLVEYKDEVWEMTKTLHKKIADLLEAE